MLVFAVCRGGLSGTEVEAALGIAAVDAVPICFERANILSCLNVAPSVAVFR